MSETRGVPLRLIWLRRLNQSSQWYDSDAHKNFVLAFRFYTLKIATCLKITIKTIWGVSVISVWRVNWRPSHITANSGSSVSIISVSAEHFATHSYRSRFDGFGARILGIPYRTYSTVALIKNLIDTTAKKLILFFYLLNVYCRLKFL